MTYYHNPYADNTGPGTIIEGRQLKVGEKVQKGDFYASTDGIWKPAGSSVGITIESTKVIWVRPNPPQPVLNHPRLTYKGILIPK